MNWMVSSGAASGGAAGAAAGGGLGCVGRGGWWCRGCGERGGRYELDGVVGGGGWWCRGFAGGGVRRCRGSVGQGGKDYGGGAGLGFAGGGVWWCGGCAGDGVRLVGGQRGVGGGAAGGDGAGQVAGGGDGHGDDHGQGGHDPAQPAAGRVGQAPPDPGGQRRPGVGAAGGESRGRPGQPCRQGPGPALRVTRGPQVPAGGLRAGDLVADHRCRLVDQDALRVAPADAQAQLGVLPARRDGDGPGEHAGKPPAILQDRAAEGHVGGQEGTHRNAAGRHPLVGAAHHPVQLRSKPRRPAIRPLRPDHAAHAEHPGILVVPGQRGQPARTGGRTIVQERDDIALGHRHAGVPRARQTRPEPVRHHGDVPRQQLGQQPGLVQQLRAMVDDQDYLTGRLRAHGDDRLLQVIPPVQGAGADDHRHGQAQHRPLSRGRRRRIPAARPVVLAGIGPDQSHRRGCQPSARRQHKRGHGRRHPARL